MVLRLLSDFELEKAHRRAELHVSKRNSESDGRNMRSNAYEEGRCRSSGSPES